MARANSLMEWIDQTKKFSKSVDYMALDLIDSIMVVRNAVERKVLLRHRKFFSGYCFHYHKPNPIDLLGYPEKMSKLVRKLLSTYVTESIDRIIQMQKSVDVQWFEVIDFIYERPELVDPRILSDEYVKEHIRRVCANKKKNNPLENGMAGRLGKYWKDAKGRWLVERRKRF